jgi:DNA-binding response OmpR family regulator
LVVEDDYLIAADLAEHLAEFGVEVIGPVCSVEAALNLVNTLSVELDGASLDVNLRGERVYPVADALRARHVPFVFSTGYDAGVVPPPYRDIPRCAKPVDMKILALTLVEHVRDAKH